MVPVVLQRLKIIARLIASSDYYDNDKEVAT